MPALKRREFITLLGAAALAWPLAARAQQPAMPVVGYLYSGTPESSERFVAAFRAGLSEVGFFEGRNLAIEFRWAQNDPSRLPELARELVRRQVAVIATPGSTPATLAAKAATTTIPIVFYSGGDPVQLGLVASFNLPGGNLTGITSMNAELGSKRLGLLHELLPGATRLAVLVQSNSPLTEAFVAEVRAAAEALGLHVEVLSASNNREIDSAFTSLVQSRADALLVSSDVLFTSRRVQLITLALHHKVPAIYPFREDAEAGGLMSYGSSVIDPSRQVGIYTGRILRGEKPADLPVMRSSRFELVINLQVAKLLDLTVPSTLLARADEVIE
jgi:putative tryptophan/tyrosine transport system substrate-binding protein